MLAGFFARSTLRTCRTFGLLRHRAHHTASLRRRRASRECRAKARAGPEENIQKPRHGQKTEQTAEERAGRRDEHANAGELAGSIAICRARSHASWDRCQNASSPSLFFRTNDPTVGAFSTGRQPPTTFFLKHRLANRKSICISSLTSAAQMIPGSSAVEHSTVNR